MLDVQLVRLQQACLFWLQKRQTPLVVLLNPTMPDLNRVEPVLDWF